MAREEGIDFPETLSLSGRLVEIARYGENPHQAGAVYRTDDERPGVASAELLQGKEMSYNNYADTDAAFELAAEFREPAVVIVKHANPCGVAKGKDLRAAWERAFACDPVSAFGGIVAVNRTLDAATAEEIAKIFVEVIIAPEADEAAVALLARKGALRLLVTGGMPDPAAPGVTFRSLAGGFLVQRRDTAVATPNDLKTVTKRAPTKAEIADLIFADTVAKHVKSNAIVFAKDGATVGIGAGQPSRVDSAKIAVAKAADMQKAAGLRGVAGARRGDGVGRVLPVRRWARSRDRRRHHRRHPARRLAPRRRGDRRRRQGRHRHGVHRHAALPALNRSKTQFDSIRDQPLIEDAIAAIADAVSTAGETWIDR